jgi:hypothetical protein
MAAITSPQGHGASELRIALFADYHSPKGQ